MLSSETFSIHMNKLIGLTNSVLLFEYYMVIKSFQVKKEVTFIYNFVLYRRNREINYIARINISKRDSVERHARAYEIFIQWAIVNHYNANNNPSKSYFRSFIMKVY